MSGQPKTRKRSKSVQSAIVHTGIDPGGKRSGFFSNDTEILTPGGWKKYTEINVGDECYSFHPETYSGTRWRSSGLVPNLIKSRISRIIVSKNCKFVNIATQNIDAMVTEDFELTILPAAHRIKALKNIPADKHSLVNGISYGLHRKRSIDLPRRSKIPLCGVYTYADKKYIRLLSKKPEDRKRWLWLLGMFISDGFEVNRGNGIAIVQSKPDIVRKIKSTIKFLGLQHHEYCKRQKGTVSIGGYIRNYDKYTFTISGISALSFRDMYLHGKMKRRSKVKKFTWKYPKLPDKTIPLWAFNLKRSHFLELFDGLIDGDGSRMQKVSEAFSYYGNDKMTMDTLQALCSINGFRTSMRTRRGNSHELSICSLGWADINSGVSITSVNKKKAEVVWNVEIDNMSILVRRNGKTFIA